MTALGCAVDDLVCARSKTADQILTAQLAANAHTLVDDKWTTWALVERPMIDNILISAEFSQLIKTGQYSTQASILWRTIHDEGGYFANVLFPNPVSTAKQRRC